MAAGDSPARELAVRIHSLFTAVGAAGASTDALAQASANLAVCFKQQDAIPALVHILADPSTLPHVRQLAALETRKLVERNDASAWLALQEQTRDAIKPTLLQLALAEQSTLVRNAIARIISEIAKPEIASGKWADLIPSLMSLASSSVPAQREVAIVILYALFDLIADDLADHLSALLPLFASTISDPESLQVAVTTVQSIGKIADFVDDDQSPAFKTIRDLVPAMITVLQRCLAAADSDSAIKIFEVFENFLLLEIPILGKHFSDILALYLSIAQSPQNSDDVRVMALSFVMQCIAYSRSKIQKLGLVARIIAAVMPIAATEEPEDRDQHYPAKSALQVIHTLATSFAPQTVYPSVMQHVVSYAANTDPNFRRAALLALALLVEGCADHMRERFDDFLPLVVSALQDAHSAVRRAACTAVGSLAEDLGEELSEKHVVLLPLLLSLMDDPDPEVQPVVLSTIDNFVDSLEDGLLPYLDSLMNKLVEYMASPNRKTALTATTCIGSAARAVGQAFAPYFEVTMSRLHNLMSMTAVTDLDLRAVATDAVGALAEAIGKEAFVPYMNGVMELAIAGIHIDNSTLRDHSYVLFGVLARVFKEDFSPYLSLIVPQILASCNLEDDDWNALLDKDMNKHKDKMAQMGDDGDIDLDDDDEEDEEGRFNVNSAISQEKVSSLDALGDLFAATRSAFMPYVTDSVNAAIAALDNFNDDVRTSAAQCLLRFFQTVYVMSGATEWEAGLPLKVAVHENVSAMGKMAMEGVLTMLEDEISRMVVIHVLQTLGETIKEVGPVALSMEYSDAERPVKRHADVLGNLLLQMFRADHPCQVSDLENASDGNGQDDEELAELDALLISSAGDVVVSIVAALGEHASAYFQAFLPLIGKHYRKNRPVSDRSMAVGVLAEACECLKGGVTQFEGELLPLFMKALRDDESEVRSNAAYGVGVVVQNSRTDLSGMYGQLLPLLHALFVDGPECSSTNMVDNACGAVARMTLRSASAMPLESVLPVLLRALPLRRDLQENEAVYRCLAGLVETQHVSVAVHLPRLKELFQSVLLQPQSGLSPATTARLELLLR